MIQPITWVTCKGWRCLGQAQSAHRASSSRLASTSSSPSCQGRRRLSLDLWSILLHWCLVTKQSSHVKSCQVICCLIWCLSRVSFDTCCILVQLVQLYSLMYSLCCQLYCVKICYKMLTIQYNIICYNVFLVVFLVDSHILAPRPSGPPQRITADSVTWTDVRAWRPGQSDNPTISRRKSRCLRRVHSIFIYIYILITYILVIVSYSWW